MSKKKLTEEQPDKAEKTIKTKEILRYPFKDEEMLDRGRTLARKQNELVQLDLDKKSVVKQCDQKIAAVEAEISLLSRQISDGFEFRHIDCETRYYYAYGLKKTVRLDTEEIIREEALTADELQMSLHEEDGTGI